MAKQRVVDKMSSLIRSILCTHNWIYCNTYLKTRKCSKCGKYQMHCAHKQKYENMGDK